MKDFNKPMNSGYMYGSIGTANYKLAYVNLFNSYFHTFGVLGSVQGTWALSLSRQTKLSFWDLHSSKVKGKLCFTSSV